MRCGKDTPRCLRAPGDVSETHGAGPDHHRVEGQGAPPSGVGYLLKQRVGDLDSFTHDLRRVAVGGTASGLEVVSALVARSVRDNASVESLTPRQRQVLGLIAEARSNAAIAAALVITEKAVARHASQIYDALASPQTSMITATS